MIVDWDVHHGNGTEDIYPRPRRCAVRQHPPGGDLPGTGPLTDAGVRDGEASP